jgi:hypothetical protein
MGEQDYPLECRDDDVVAFGDDTFKVSKFRNAVKQCFGYDFGYGLLSLLGNHGVKISKDAIAPEGNNDDYTKWFNEGVDCEILKTDARGWHKAKVKIKISVEFVGEVEDNSTLIEQHQQDTDATLHNPVIFSAEPEM